MPIPPSQLWETWSGLVKRQPGRVAIHLWPKSETITFRELDEQVRHWSEAIRGQSLHAGDRILVRTGNTPAFIAVFLACARLRLVMVPLEIKTNREETRAVAERFGARALITSRGCIPLSPATGDSSAPPAETVLLKLASGTTEAPRGIAHSGATLAADCANICASMNVSPGDINLAVISLAHSCGFSNLVLPLITQGTSMTLLNEFVPRAALDALEKTRVTVLPAVPFMFECLNELPTPPPRLPHLRACISADAQLAPEIAQTFHERFGHKIHSFYGCSECGGITCDASDDTASVGTHVGTPLKNVHVNLVAAGDDRGEPALSKTEGPPSARAATEGVDVVGRVTSRGESATPAEVSGPTTEGRIRVRSAAVSLSYWPTSKEDKATLHDGVFLTDDLGRFDDHGRLVRIGNFIDVAAKK